MNAEQHAIVHGASAGILIVDAKRHTILDANAAALKVIGRPRETVLGKCCHNFVCPAEMGKCPITDLRLPIDCSERALLDARGSRVRILKSAVPVVLNGRPCLVECFLDLSDQKLTDAEVERARGELRYATRLVALGCSVPRSFREAFPISQPAADSPGKVPPGPPG